MTSHIFWRLLNPSSNKAWILSSQNPWTPLSEGCDTIYSLPGIIFSTSRAVLTVIMPRYSILFCKLVFLHVHRFTHVSLFWNIAYYVWSKNYCHKFYIFKSYKILLTYERYTNVKTILKYLRLYFSYFWDRNQEIPEF